MIVIIEMNIPRTLQVAPHKLFIPRRTFVLVVARQHALDAHAYALDVLHGAPALIAQQVQTDDAVGVDMGVHRDGAIRGLNERHFRRFCGPIPQWTGNIGQVI